MQIDADNSNSEETSAHQHFQVFSVLHDKSAAEVSILMEVTPPEICVQSDMSCVLSEHKVKPVQQTHPFYSTPPYEGAKVVCIIVCPLPATVEALQHVELRDKHDTCLVKHDVEQVEHPNVPLGVGVCAGPILLASATFADWLDWTSKLGVNGIHAYAPIFEPVDPRSRWYWHTEFSHPHPAQFYQHHLLHWRAYSLDVDRSSHYFGQFVLYTDCLIRNRYKYAFLAFIDVDEFIYLHQPQRVQQVGLANFLQEQLQETNAGMTLISGLSPAACFSVNVTLADSTLSRRAIRRPTHRNTYMTYNGGVDIWGAVSSPDFTDCQKRFCHPKMIVRPTMVKIVNVHTVQRFAQDNFNMIPFPVEHGFIVHIRCIPGLDTVVSTAALCEKARGLFRQDDEVSQGGVLMCERVTDGTAFDTTLN